MGFGTGSISQEHLSLGEGRAEAGSAARGTTALAAFPPETPCLALLKHKAEPHSLLLLCLFCFPENRS